MPAGAQVDSPTPAAYRHFALPQRWQEVEGAVTGLLFSQVGYDLGESVRVVVRLPDRALLADSAVCHLRLPDGADVHQAACTYWGAKWNSHWWVAEFANITEAGEWTVEVREGSEVRFAAPGLRVAEDVLWNSTHEYSSVDMLERRLHFTKVGTGWMDAGTLWVESPAQSAMIICLTDLVQYADDRGLSEDFRERLYQQLTVGCDYLVVTQNKAQELGFPAGAMSHDVLGHEKEILPNDAAKAVVALLRAAAALPGAAYPEKRATYLQAARLTYDWLIHTAQPLGDHGLVRLQRGLPDDAFIPDDEWPTRDLVFLCWGALELWKNGDESAGAQCAGFARQIMDRQFTEAAPEQGYYGHFKEFDSAPHSEKSWVHSIYGGVYGVDAGGLYPHYLVPLLELLDLHPDHADAGRWRSTLAHFAEGFLIPACRQSPFLIIPNGVFGQAGLIYFAGPMHGCNSIYGYTAALALRLERLLDLPELRAIAVGNLQWIAGLNAGVTKDCLMGSIVYDEEIPDGVALPRSMICRIGNNYAGTWFNTKGVVCNGFSVGEQFKHDVFPTAETDGPYSFTDEDWIPHSAGWLTGLLHL